MSRREMVLIVVAFVMLFVGLECGYRIGRRAPVGAAYDAGFQACQEQF